jgi:hypothetical protein
MPAADATSTKAKAATTIRVGSAVIQAFNPMGLSIRDYRDDRYFRKVSWNIGRKLDSAVFGGFRRSGRERGTRS